MSEKNLKEILKNKFEEYRIFELSKKITQINALRNNLDLINVDPKKYLSQIFIDHLKGDIDFREDISENDKITAIEWIVSNFDFLEKSFHDEFSTCAKKFANEVMRVKLINTKIDTYQELNIDNMADSEVQAVIDSLDNLSQVAQDLQEMVNKISSFNRKICSMLERQLYTKLNQNDFDNELKDKLVNAKRSYRDISQGLSGRNIAFLDNNNIQNASDSLITLAGIMTTKKINEVHNIKKFEGVSVGLQDFASIALNSVINESQMPSQMIIWSQDGNDSTMAVPLIKIQKTNGDKTYSYKAVFDSQNQLSVQDSGQVTLKAYEGRAPLMENRNGNSQIIALSSQKDGGYSHSAVPQAISLFMVNMNDQWKSVVVYNNKDTQNLISSIPTYQLDYAEKEFSSLIRNVINIEPGKEYIFSLTPNDIVYFPVNDVKGRNESKSFSAAIQSADDTVNMNFDLRRVSNSQRTEAVYLRVKEAMPNGKDYIAAAFVFPGENFPGK